MTAIRAQQLFLVEIPTPLSENQQIILAYGQQNDRPFNRIQDSRLFYKSYDEIK
jgi:hypothetical protein